MLRLFLIVSVLFWNQLAAQDADEKVSHFCRYLDCIEPLIIIKGEKYDTMEFDNRQWIETEVNGKDADSIQVGLEKLFNYSHFGNGAGTIVPISAPWGIYGALKNDELQPRVFLMLVPELKFIPNPLDETVRVGRKHSGWFYVRAFDQKVELKQYPELMTEFMKDLKQDNKKFNEEFVIIAVYRRYGLMEIGFPKIEE